MSTAFAIWKKDLVDALVNLRLLAFMVMPILMSVLSGSLFGGLREGDVPVGLASEPGPANVVPVYDAGESQIVRLLDASELYDVLLVASPEEMQHILAKEHLGVGLILPEGFDVALVEGSQPTLQLVVSARRGDGGGLSAHDEALRTWLTHALWDRTGQAFPSTVTVETLFPQEKRPLSQRQEQMALWLVMSLTTIGVYVVPALLIEEKRSRTLNAVLTTPASYKNVVLAKAGVGLVYGLLTSALILGLNRVGDANPSLLIGAVLLGALVLVEAGLLLGGLFDNMVALNTWSTLVMLVLMLPGMVYGLLASGLFRLEALQWIVRLLPTYYILEIVHAAFSSRIVPERIGIDLALMGGLVIFLFFLVTMMLRCRER